MGVAADDRDAEEPLHVPVREEITVEFLELTDGVGDGKQPPGHRGHREVLTRRTSRPAAA